jgi:hypothetical protein
MAVPGFFIFGYDKKIVRAKDHFCQPGKKEINFFKIELNDSQVQQGAEI